MKYTPAFIAVLVFVLPFAASADQVSDLQAQVRVLSKLMTQLEQQRAPVSGAARPTSSAGCSAIAAPLASGSSGVGVSQLQQFLGSNAAIYPEAKVTGYYGALTQAAVQRFQAANGIVSSGTPSSTGYGKVGPKTAVVILSQCGGGTTNPTAVNMGEVGGFIQVSPVEGKAPLQVNVQATVNTTNSCTTGLYTLDVGDGSQVQSINVQAGTCKTLQQTYTHTYSAPGVYRVTLAAGDHRSNATVVVR